MSSPEPDSPISLTASITGILTFLVAISAAIWLRVSAARAADTEFTRVKTALGWYKTESEWIGEIAYGKSRVRGREGDSGWRQAEGGGERGQGEGHSGRMQRETERMGERGGERQRQVQREKEREMYAFVLEQLGRLEERLLEIVAGVEVRAEGDWQGEVKGSATAQRWGWECGLGLGWGKLKWWTRTPIGVHWLPVRTKALELVRQRDALGNRVLFSQLAMVSSRLADSEARAERLEESIGEVLEMVRTSDGRGRK